MSVILTAPTDLRPVHRTPIQVRLAETDLMAIVHHSVYVVYLELARIDFLQKQGVSYAALVDGGTHFPVVDLSIRYSQSARFGDSLEAETWAAKATRVTLDFCQRIWRVAPTGNVLLTEALVTVACINNDRRLQRIPDPLCEAVGVSRGK